MDAAQWPPAAFPGMGAPNFAAFMPPQLWQDVMMLSKPVDPTDEPLLVKTLAESRRKNETAKDALNRLHGTAGHSASLWKDYYLDHKERIDEAVAAVPLPKTVKKPTLHVPSPAYSPSPSPPPPPRPRGRPKKPANHTPMLESTGRRASTSARRRQTPLLETGGRRQTINSLTAPLAPVYNPRLPPPSTLMRVPDAPSRSPSPPTTAIPHNRGGYKFTPEDKKYFIDFISWRLKEDPTMVRHELCEELARKVPHHGVNSWASYWSNNHDIPDKLVALARDRAHALETPDARQPGASKSRLPAPRPVYKELSSDSELTEPSAAGDEQTSDLDDEQVELPTDDESKMGGFGEPFTDADWGAVVRHIANFDNWDDASTKEKWCGFAEKYPARSYRSWDTFYRRGRSLIHRMVEKLQQHRAEEAGGSRGPPKGKRKLAGTGSGNDSKRRRTESESE
uniref:Uncharacterized protein n=1 Tax=Mycena chlorophos TaxID=658473 RepID=A0ABQ0L9Q6_MYCCL|nr:predicted protein [Mycena chlorophos]